MAADKGGTGADRVKSKGEGQGRFFTADKGDTSKKGVDIKNLT